MKTQTLIICFFLNVAFSFSQNQYNVVSSSHKWNILSEGTGFDITQIIRFSEQDTIIGSFSYKKVLASFDPDETDWVFMDAIIREDTVTREVFMRNSVDDEQRIYDFSLIVGDTIDIRNVLSGPSFQLEVIEIDSLLIDYEFRKRFYLESVGWPYYDVWVEGIGSLLHGVIYCGFYNTSPWFKLLCFKENNNVYYMNPDYTGCYYPPVSIQENESKNDYFKFNPSTNQIILNQPSQNVSFVFYNLFGQEIYSGDILHSSESGSINTTTWPSGIYIGVVYEGALPLVSQKIFIP